MSACHCPTILGDCIGVDSPITGISSETDDRCLFYASCSPRADAFAPPPLGGGIVTQSCAYTVLAGATQAEADALAAAACGGGGGGGGGGGNQVVFTELHACWDAGYSGAIPGLVGDSFSLSGGSLPPGLSLNLDGTIFGNPNTPGVFYFTVLETDLEGGLVTKQVSFSVLGVFVAWPPGGSPSLDLPEGIQGSDYSAIISVAGGPAPISFSLTGPAAIWLSVSDTGYLSGVVPLILDGLDKTWLFSIMATDGLGHSCASGFSILVRPCHWAPQNLPYGTQGVGYSQAMYSEGGIGPFTFALASGTLPPGLSLASDGTVSGTPTYPAWYSCSVAITDSTGVVCDVQLTILIVDAGTCCISGGAGVIASQAGIVHVTVSGSLVTVSGIGYAASDYACYGPPEFCGLPLWDGAVYTVSVFVDPTEADGEEVSWEFSCGLGIGFGGYSVNVSPGTQIFHPGGSSEPDIFTVTYTKNP